MPLFFYFAKFTKHIMRNRPTGVLEKSRRAGSIPELFLFYFYRFWKEVKGVSSEEFALMLCDLFEMDLYFPNASFYTKDFTKASYSMWTIHELVNHVRFYLDPPGNVRTVEEIIHYVKDFQQEMDKFSKLNPLTGQMFSIAKDITTDVLDVLLAMK